MEPEGGIGTSWEGVFTHQPGCWIITWDSIHKQNLSCMCLFGGFQRGKDWECRFSSLNLHLLPFWERHPFNLPAQNYTTLNVSWSARKHWPSEHWALCLQIQQNSVLYFLFLFVTRRLTASCHHLFTHCQRKITWSGCEEGMCSWRDLLCSELDFVVQNWVLNHN
jgi:hypothetical protein